MIGTVENRLGKIIYGVLQVALLVIAVYTFKPSSPDMGDDWTTIGLILLMGLLSFPIGIIAVPLAFYLTCAIFGILYILVGRFIEIGNLSPIIETAFIFLIWLGIFTCGYLQWFWFPRWSDKRLGINRKSHF